MKRGWSNVALTDIATLERRPVDVSETGSYPEVGVRCFGKGLFHKAPRSGLEVGDKKLFRLKRGDFILQVTFAWEGAVAVVSAEDESLFGSVRVLTFEIDKKRATPEFLFRYFQTRAGVEQLARISPGSAGRNRVLALQRLGEVSIPLPSLAEQQRLTDRLDFIETRLTRIRQLRMETGLKRDALTTSLHLAMSKARVVRLGHIIELTEEQCAVVPAGSYPQVGIRSFGLGLFKKPPVAGTATTYRSFNVLRPGMFIMSQVKGWEGAIGVCGADFDGWFVSPEYRTFTCVEGLCDPAYLSHLVVTPWFRDQLASATRGVGARRERVRPEMLLRLEMPFPAIEKQRVAAKALGQLRMSQEVSGKADTTHDALIPSLLSQFFSN